MKTGIKRLSKSEIEIDFELTAEEFGKYVDKALMSFKEHVKLDGFRKGQVPLKMVEGKVKKEDLLMEAGDLAVKAEYTKLVNQRKLEPIGEPEVQITKIAKGSEFLFKVKVTVLPEIQLPDYKEIVSQIKAKEISVDEKEIQETIDYLQKSRAKFTTEHRQAQNKDFVEIEYQTQALNGGKEIKDRFILGEGGFLKDFEENVVGMKAGQEKEFSVPIPKESRIRDRFAIGTKFPDGEELTFKVKMLSVQKMELAKINDDFAKSLGAFDTLEALKENLKEGIVLEKKETERQRIRGEMLEKISVKTVFDIPPKMVQFEEERLLEDLKLQVNNQFNTSFESYLASVKKTEQEIKDTFKLEAEKRIKNFLVLREIGRKEHIEVSPQEIAKDMPKLMKNYTKEQLEKIDIGRLTEYSKGAIFNEKVFQRLETFSK